MTNARKAAVQRLRALIAEIEATSDVDAPPTNFVLVWRTDDEIGEIQNGNMGTLILLCDSYLFRLRGAAWSSLPPDVAISLGGQTGDDDASGSGGGVH